MHHSMIASARAKTDCGNSQTERPGGLEVDHELEAPASLRIKTVCVLALIRVRASTAKTRIARASPRGLLDSFECCVSLKRG